MADAGSNATVNCLPRRDITLHRVQQLSLLVEWWSQLIQRWAGRDTSARPREVGTIDSEFGDNILAAHNAPDLTLIRDSCFSFIAGPVASCDEDKTQQVTNTTHLQRHHA